MGIQRCQAVECDALVLPSRLMCQPHWLMIPVATREQLHAAHRAGWSVNGSGVARAEDKEAARAAIDAVAALENREAPGAY